MGDSMTNDALVVWTLRGVAARMKSGMLLSTALESAATEIERLAVGDDSFVKGYFHDQAAAKIAAESEPSPACPTAEQVEAVASWMNDLAVETCRHPADKSRIEKGRDYLRALQSALDAAREERDKLKQKLVQATMFIKNASVVEIGGHGNTNVKSYCEHWETRAEKAEATNEGLRRERDTAIKNHGDVLTELHRSHGDMKGKIDIAEAHLDKAAGLLRRAVDCIEASTEFRLGNPAFEQCQAAIQSLLAEIGKP